MLVLLAGVGLGGSWLSSVNLGRPGIVESRITGQWRGPSLVRIGELHKGRVGTLADRRKVAGVANRWAAIINKQAVWVKPATQRRPCSFRVANSSGRVNTLIARLANTITRPTAICLAGVFRHQIRIVGKVDPAWLTVESAPGSVAIVRLGSITGQTAPSVGYDALNPAVVILGSSDVGILGLRVEDVIASSNRLTPTGIDVEVNAKRYTGTASPCLRRGCHGIVLADNTVTFVQNRADEALDRRQFCGNPAVDALGIVVDDFGRGVPDALERVVIAGNTIEDTRTGDSENLVVNGDIRRYVVAGNRVVNGDNIGIDLEGWYNRTTPPLLGLVQDNEVANSDTTTNTAAGTWVKGRCESSMNAGGIYDDGAQELWIRDNRIIDTNQGISLDVENAGKRTSQLWVTDNTVFDSPGTSNGAPSYGPSPFRWLGPSPDAGHAFDALYIDAFGPHSMITHVLIAKNDFTNLSEHFARGGTAQASVVVVGGRYQAIAICNNTIRASGHDPTSVVQIGDRSRNERTIVFANNRLMGLAPHGTNFELGDATATSMNSWRRLRHRLSPTSSKSCALAMRIIQVRTNRLSGVKKPGVGW
ncbi:MAG: hypothetical protein MP439_02735 [Ferrimicrobium sp.]|nr:hypothetical protein [Ferrimicrobium sp.]